MSPGRTLRSVLFVALSAALPGAQACSSSSSADQSQNSLTAGVLREGDATDATLVQVLDTGADGWGWAGGVFDSPTDQAVLEPAPPFTFAWHADSTSAPSGAGAAGASASDAGFSGMVYLLVFSTPSNAKLLRVFTTDTTYTPDAAAWKTLVSVNGPITLNVTTSTFADGTLTADGGPHNGQTLSFTING
jgi:hypothetical protein